MIGPEIPVALIRGGTSRGVFLRASDLSPDGHERNRQIVRLFGGDTATVADGLGGENPVLRKVAVVAPLGPDDEGDPRVSFTFGQIEADLRTLRHVAECGNISAGVPVFSVIHGWAPPPRDLERLRIELPNTGRTLIAQWLGPATTSKGTVRLGFVSPAESRHSALFARNAPIYEATLSGRTVRYSAIRAINDYLFVDARSLGIERPQEISELEIASFDTLCELATEAQTLLNCPAPKVCLVAPSPRGEGAVSALIVYPSERRLHGAFAVTGAVALGVASCLEGTVPHEMARLGARTSLDISHKSGVLSVELVRGHGEIPDRVGIERSYRVLMRGTAS